MMKMKIVLITSHILYVKTVSGKAPQLQAKTGPSSWMGQKLVPQHK